MTGEATPATWNSNEEDLVLTDYTEKLAYFKKMYGSPSSLPDINLIKEAFKVLDRVSFHTGTGNNVPRLVTNLTDFFEKNKEFSKI